MTEVTAVVEDTHLIETTVSSAVMAQGKMLTVRYDEARLPNGRVSSREYVTHPGAVAIVALTQSGEVVLERQFRYPLKQVFIELPAGKIDAGEPVLTTGQRELLEETGYTAKTWVKLGIQHPCIGYSNEVIHMYLATELSLGAHARDVDEAMDVMVWPFARVMQAIEDGEITDSKTMSAMLMAERYLRKHPVAGLAL
ncbi:NUDIX domain-containing protein [Methylophilus sp. 3sh_L]|uniref:NUDIX domain-containing protein n=1 Tax=Methylophilus sp. 3sh_L TaxID=3377114 RepID=UPI00398E47C1